MNTYKFSELSLREIINNGKVNMELFFKIAISIVDTLMEFQDKEIVNYRIYPENIIVYKDQGGYYVRLLNRQQDYEYIKYMAPEEAGQINAKYSFKKDFYTLGMIFYEMVIGDSLIKDDDNLEINYFHLTFQFKKPSNKCREVPQILWEILKKLLDKNPELRYTSYYGLKADLEKCLNQYQSLGFINNFTLGKNDCSAILFEPKKLYGKMVIEKWKEKIYKNAYEENKYILILKGDQGTGKTSVVTELKNVLNKNNDYYISVAVQKKHKMQPYFFMINGFKTLINRILMENENNILLWRERFRNILGDDVEFIEEHIPEFKLILGNTSEKNNNNNLYMPSNFISICKKIIEVFTENNHLFMLCIDDIRCIDIESLNFIGELVKTEIKNFFLVCTWTGTKSSIQFKSFENQLNELKALIEIIELESLNTDDIKTSCFGDLADSIENCDELCNIVKIKSGGNLYFANKFIKEINKQGLIKYNYEKKCFQFIIEKISLLPGKEKLVNYIKETIRELTDEVKAFLKIASCFREKFSIYQMAELCDKTTSEMINLINICVNKDLIIELEPGEYVFASRKIIEAVNCTMKLEEQNANLIKIARSLKVEYDKGLSTVNVFEILYYYNKVKNELKDEKEILFLVQLNFEGGIYAGKSYSYSDAAKYFDIAINYINSNYWIKYYKLSFDIYLNTIDCLYSNSDFEKADYYSDILFEKAKGKIDKCKLYQVRIRQYTRWNKIKPAVSMAYRAINLMESSVMARNYLNKKSSRAEFRKLIKILKSKKINEFINLPKNNNTEKKVLMDVYSNLWTLGYISSKKQMCIAASLGMFKISTYYGNSENSAFGYAGMAAALIDFGEYELGEDFAQLALMVNSKGDNAQLNCSVKFIYGDKIRSYFERLGAGGDYLEEAYNSAIKCKDLVFASNSAISMIYQKFIFGERLPKLKYLLDKIINSMKISNNELACLYILKKDITFLMDNECNTEEKVFNEGCISSRNQFYFCTSRAFQAYIMGEYHSALGYIEKSQEFIKEKVNVAVKIMNNCIYSLILTSIYPGSTKSKKIKYKAKINQLNDNLKKHYAVNDEDQIFLVLAAESARINEDHIKAMQLYELALKQAEVYEDKYFKAICNELSFKYYLSRNIMKMAEMYFNDCVKDYECLGIKIKVKKLNEEYGKNFSINRISWDINFNALFKSAQIISSEMDYNILLKKLIRITMKRAGAERCCLVIERKERLYLLSDTRSENMNIEICKDGIPLENYDPMVKNVVYYVSRCRETLVIDDVKNTEFYYGKNIIENSVKSVLCIPICYNNKIKAILYFENNLIKGAFNKEAIEILKMLTSHTATSIENATMYNSIKEMNEKLESIVLERTKELEITVNKLKEEVEERKIVEEALLESENRLRTLINNTSDCITFKDEMGRYVEINAAAQQLLGLEKIDYKNKTILELYKIAGGNKKTFFKIEGMDNIVKNEKREMRFNEILVNEFGEENYYDIINSPVFNKQGEPKAMIVIARNITEREKAKALKKECIESAKRLEEIMEYDKMRTEFIANISHELRTPLNVILSSNQMCDFLVNAQTQSKPVEGIKKYIGMTKQNCYRLLRLTNNLIDITKIDSGYLNSQFVKGDIVNFIEGVTMSVVTFAESKGITIIFDTQIEEKNISFDSDKIERIMLNLLSNAIKFTPPNGLVYVNIYDYFDKISISVKDTGVGIPEEKMPDVFKRFVQLDKSFSRANEGSGIGLALVKSLVDMHKGSISLNSEIGKGSEFIVTIPAYLDETKVEEKKLIKCSAEEKIERVKIEFSDIYF